MPKVSDVFGNTFLRATDVTEPLVADVEGWGSEIVFGETVYFLTLRDQAVRLRLNQTNANDVARLYGEDFDRWVGREIEIYSTRIEIQDRKTGEPKQVDMLRVRAPSHGGNSQPPLAKSMVPAKSATRRDLDDEMPF
jgi:hypothetical protein